VIHVRGIFSIVSGKRIALVVEDETFVRMDLTDILQTIGYETLEAADADEAEKILQAHPGISLVLSDINMPGRLDGLALAQLIREEYPEKRVALVSANHPSKLNIPPAVPFVRKPFAVSEIIKVVEELTGEAA
jgi:CheY-like chemotaxis protein